MRRPLKRGTTLYWDNEDLWNIGEELCGSRGLVNLAYIPFL